MINIIGISAPSQPLCLPQNTGETDWLHKSENSYYTNVPTNLEK